MIAGGVGRSAANVFNFFVMMMTNRSIGAGAQVVKYDNVIETEKGSNNLLWFICSGLVCMGILIGFVLGVLFDQYFLRYARLDPDRRQERRPDDDQDLRQERPERGPDDDQDLRQERPERGPDDDQDRHQKRPERGPDDYDTRSTYGSDRHDTTPEDHPGPTTTTPRTSIPVAATTIPPIPMISTWERPVWTTRWGECWHARPECPAIVDRQKTFFRMCQYCRDFQSVGGTTSSAPSLRRRR